MDTTITTIEMCAGYGGIGLGLKRIFGERLRTIAYCELEGFAQANLISKMEKGYLDAAPLWNDLKTFPYESFHGLVDILIAGYPCQPFSAAGKRAGKDDPRHLWPWIADGIRILRPRMCFLENVEGHISLGLSTVISDLEELGYKVSWGIFSASEVGAPHQRKRVFILAYKQCEGLEGAAGQSIQRSVCGFAGNGKTPWPSRPGEQQFWWEPPRVVDSSSSRQQAQRDESVSERQEGLVGEPSGCGAETMGNAASERSCGGQADGFGQQSEVLGSGYEAMGNAEQQGSQGQWNNIASINRGNEGIQLGAADGCDSNSREIKPTLGGDADGPAGRLGYAELQVSCDNRTDELRLLGNGVVPATAERAFRVLIEELNK